MELRETEQQHQTSDKSSLRRFIRFVRMLEEAKSKGDFMTINQMMVAMELMGLALRRNTVYRYLDEMEREGYRFKKIRIEHGLRVEYILL